MIINLFLLGYIVQFGTWVLDTIFGVGIVLTLPQQLVIMAAALIILTFGLAMYQVAELGVAPYDFVALGLAEKLPVPYFVLRVGTVIAAFFLGPLVAYFSKLHQKWVRWRVTQLYFCSCFGSRQRNLRGNQLVHASMTRDFLVNCLGSELIQKGDYRHIIFQYSTRKGY